MLVIRNHFPNPRPKCPSSGEDNSRQRQLDMACAITEAFMTDDDRHAHMFQTVLNRGSRPLLRRRTAAAPGDAPSRHAVASALRPPPPLSTTLGSSLGLKPTPTWSLASPLREQMPACSSTPMLNAAALKTLSVPLAHGPLRLPKRDAGAP